MNAPDLADVLAEVNRLRGERGMEPLDAMPKGARGEAAHCPLAVALCARTVGKRIERGAYSIWFPDDDEITAPPTLAAFASHFDGEGYPELVA